MSYHTRKIVDTYFEILMREGIPEKFVADFTKEGDEVVVTILTGKKYSRKVKSDYVEATRDVRAGMVQDAGIASREPEIPRDRTEATHDVQDARDAINSQIQ